MNVTLENDRLLVKIKLKGAELYSAVNKGTGLEYMWGGDPAFWGKTSPVLFPIVGTLKNQSYLYKGKYYNLTRHGFARDATFEISEQAYDRVILSLSNDSSTLKKFPFPFELQLEYKVAASFIEVTYRVGNIGEEDMYFSIGGHPAFKVPITGKSRYDHHYLLFDKIENVGRWPISPEGLIEEEPVSLIKNSTTLRLTRELFDEDALVFKNLKSDKVSIKSDDHAHGIDFYFSGFPYLGIWAAKNADFVCIEPWCGLADSVTHDQQLQTKEGIINLSPGKCWSRVWKVRFY